MAVLDRLAILQADDLPRVKVDIPEWKGSIWIRSVSAAEQDRFEAECKAKDTENIRARYAVLCACSEDGTRLFSDEDAEALGKKSRKAIDRIVEAAQALNGTTAETVEAAKGN